MNSDFEPPPKSWSILATVGGVITAVIAIATLNLLSQNLSRTSPVKKPETSTSQTASLTPKAEVVARLEPYKGLWKKA